MRIGKKSILLIFILVVFAAGFYFYKASGLTIDTVNWEAAKDYYNEHKVIVISGFFAFYVAATAFSIPIATLLTFAAGAIFGTLTGTIIVSFASAIGASLAFLSARYIFRESIEKKYPEKAAAINKRFDNEGSIYLLILRFIPIVPFFLVNILMGLTSMRLWIFYFFSQLGMLPGTFIYVNAGASLRSISSWREIFSFNTVASILLILGFAILSKYLSKKFKKKEI